MPTLRDGVPYDAGIAYDAPIEYDASGICGIEYDFPVTYDANIEYDAICLVTDAQTDIAAADVEWWPLERIKKRKDHERALREREFDVSAAVEAAYRRMTETSAPPATELVEEMRETVKPFTTSAQAIDWGALAQDYDAIKTLMKIWRRIQFLQQQEDEAAALLLLIH